MMLSLILSSSIHLIPPNHLGPIGWKLGTGYAVGIHRNPSCDYAAGPHLEFGSPTGIAVSFTEEINPFFWINDIADQWTPGFNCIPFPDIPETPYSQAIVNVPNDPILLGVPVWLQGFGLSAIDETLITEKTMVIFYD